MALDDFAIIITLAVVAAIALAACVSLILLMRRRTQKPALKPSKTPAELDPMLSESLSSSSRYRLAKSVQSTDATKAKDELRILDLEREIVADAIRHLYEAQAEGKITEMERERLASSYKNRMMAIKDSMAKDEGIVALHELESMQEDLMKLFSERFGELTSKVEELRTRIDVKPIKEIKIQMPKPQAPTMPDQMEKDEEEETAQEAEAEEKEKPKKPKKPPAEKQKTEAEMRIDAIRNQIDEVMNKLGQMEMES
jgi:hypothetical protein